MFSIQKSIFNSSIPQFDSLLVRAEIEKNNKKINSPYKLITPKIVYDKEGSFNLFTAESILTKAVPQSNYFMGSPNYTADRIDDTNYNRFQNNINEYPTLNSENDKLHPVELLCYFDYINLSPSESLSKDLFSLSFIEQGKAKAFALEKLNENFTKEFGFSLDLFSIPKRDVGTFCSLAIKDGFSRLAYSLGFNMHHLMPRDRIVREASSLKSSEVFLNPIKPKNYTLPESCVKYVSTLRIAFIITENSMLDSGDLMPSALPKIACKLQRTIKHTDLKKVQDQLGSLNPSYQNYRAGIEVVHQENQVLDETHTHPGSIRLVLPNGLKVNTQCLNPMLQAYDSNNQEVDLFLDTRSLESKGALCLLLSSIKDLDLSNVSIDEAILLLDTIKPEKITFCGTEYLGFIAEVPVFRPGQRYTDLSKPSNEISSDIITKAILNQKFEASPDLSDEYQEIRNFILSLHNHLNK